MRFRPGLIVVAAALVTFALADRAAAQAVGCLHLPSTCPQYFGWGYGAGHHAPIVRTPGQRPPRAPRMTAPPHCAGPLGPAAYVPMGCYGPACVHSAPGQVIQPMASARLTPDAVYVAPAAMVTGPRAPRPQPPVAMRPTPFGWR